MSEEQAKLPILYKCPYCVEGRFTAADGWDGAVRHIRMKHSESSRKKRVRQKKAQTVLPEEEEVCYSEDASILALG